MKLNVTTPENNPNKEFVGVRMYTETIDRLDILATKYNVKRSAIIRHALNEFLDAQEKI